MKIISIFYLVIFSSLFLTSANAEVVDKSPASFSIVIKAETSQSVEKAYQQFLNVSDWWDEEHSWFGSADNFYLEPKAGGCFCEVDGERQVQHMVVSYIEPNKEVRMLGGLGPLQMMAVNGAMSWSFKELESGKTLITHSYTVTGYYKEGLDTLAPIVDAVQTGQVKRLVELLSKHG